MRPMTSILLAGVSCLLLAPPARAAKLTVEIVGGENVALVGVFQRWDQDGNARKKVNPKQKIEAPEVDAAATSAGSGRWVFADLAPGRYDLVILAGERFRLEGFEYPPVLEFDPFFPGTAAVDDEARQAIADDIRKSPHYENRVEPLALGGEKKVVRVLVMLLRDKPTSYEGEFPGAATLRHEIWQYTWQYGAWVKDRRTRVLDRAILHRDELRKWTWLWDPKLGGIEVGREPVTLKYELPRPADRKLPGLYPY